MTYAWHFVGKKLRDGKPVPKDGVWLKFSGKLKLCQAGLHAGITPFDALTYAPGNTLCYVECGGKMVWETDKLVCTRRRIIARMDATELLRYYVRMHALSVVHLWEPDDVVLDYLMTGAKNLRAAALEAARNAMRNAAWASACATGSAAWPAARGAANAAAWAAERGAEWKVVRGAAWGAAWAVALDYALMAGRGAERELALAKSKKYFNDLIYECFEGVLKQAYVGK